MYLVGVDCSTDQNKTGIALAKMQDENAVKVCDVHGKTDPWGKVREWLRNLAGQNVLIAIDAPLGWPIALGAELQKHSAGKPINECPDYMFRRFTEQYIRTQIGKTPLDVGADKIARTAHAALEELNHLLDSVPLAWSWGEGELEGTHVIEVYPAATLKAHGIRSEGYKGKNKRSEREEIARNLSGKGINLLDSCFEKILDNDNILDAVVCLLAAADFARGDAARPPEDKICIARREGWIWCRPRVSQRH